MKIVYKIYSSWIPKEVAMSGHVSLIKGPDFKTETEAEEFLAILCDKMKGSEQTPFQKQHDYYYFIQKTYLQE